MASRLVIDRSILECNGIVWLFFVYRQHLLKGSLWYIINLYRHDSRSIDQCMTVIVLHYFYMCMV